METILPTSAVIAYFIGIAALALWSRAKAQSAEQFAVGNKAVSPILVGLSLAANMTSAATFIINPGLVYLYGISGFWAYSVAAPAGMFLALAIMSKRFRALGEQGGAVTIPQWLGQRFSSPALRLFFAVISLLQITFIVLIAVGLTVVLSGTLQLPQLPVLGGLLLFTVGYISVGGAAAHIKANSMQSAIMTVVALILLLSGPVFGDISFSEMFSVLAQRGQYLTAATNPESALFRDVFEVFIANFIIGIAIICQPHILSKALYLRSDKDVTVYLTTTTVVGTIFFFVLFAGLYARVILPEAPLFPPDKAMTEFINVVFPKPVLALVTVGLLAAGFSTLEGLLLALSSIFSIDVARPLLAKKIHDSEQLGMQTLRTARVFMVVLSIAVFFLSAYQLASPSLSVAIFAQNGVYGLFAATVVPIILGLFIKNMPVIVPFSSAITALCIHFGMYYGKISQWHNNPGVTAAFAIIGAVAVAIVLSAIFYNKRTAGEGNATT